MVKRFPIDTFINKKGVFGFKFHEVNPPFKSEKTFISIIPPKKVVGNHTHKRWELFIGIGKGLKIHWIDSKNNTHHDRMNPSNNKLYAFVVKPKTPHAINNTSNKECVLIEFASGKLKDVVDVSVL